MPSSRALAQELGVSRNTVFDVYERLVAQGYLSTRHGSGTFVRGSIRGDATSLSRKSTRSAEVARRFLGALPSTADTQACPANFRPGLPDLNEFPVSEWRRSAARRLRNALPGFFVEDQTQGDPQLRQHLARYLSSSRSVRCSAESILITAGAQQALDLVARVLVTRGTAVAVEDPGYVGATAVFEAAGASIVSVPVDGEGLVVSALPPSASLVYVTPSHQFPLGMAMSLRRRKELLSWASAANAWIIEDDYDSEYWFDDRRIESLQSLDKNERVIYVGTFSKVLLPSFRLGYLAMPSSLIAELLAVKWLADRHTASLAQAVLAEFMDTGAFASHLGRMQVLYMERFEILRRQLADLPADVAYLIPSHAGLHMTLLLNAAIDLPRLLVRARSEGIGLHPLAPFCQKPFSNGLILGFGNINAREVERGARWLRHALTERRGPKPSQGSASHDETSIPAATTSHARWPKN